ncbi:glycoside hydrolase family 88/105 protein [Paenibacillus abyssi]|uniref:Unsaturated rhamnogalacturonyl hydrolase YteR n=1 Tax=Paenibacillus abyssi TaxID=1340531 RepID=A0A917G0F8_9BACL|nr:glycoside hydrolase family 88 protein [Paenibacillus abyssi]GGG16501.1 unsaturated rhamnogalacturonyl hydrolase YteR [Paenibacillus abyssi]
MGPNDMLQNAARLQTPLLWGQASCDSLMGRYLPEELPPAGKWHYHQGIFLYSMLKVWEQTGDDAYLQYPKRYVDGLVDAYGNFLFARDELDAVMPGLLLFTLDERFGEPRYRAAADKLRQLFRTLNKTSEGAFWHKDKYPYQMWLDGLYMGGVFALQYADRYGDGELVPMVADWERLMRKHMYDETTGLLFHAWDESREFPWANPATGCSPELWGRSLGWYGMALADFLDILPSGHPAAEEWKGVLGRFVQGLIRFQDPSSGLWYQVVDKGELPDNWLETSCSSLFVYAISKAVKHGCIGKEHLEAARKGYEGLIARVRFDERGLIVPDICIGTSAGDYQNYVTRPVSENDLHGAGAFILACAEMEQWHHEQL